MRVFVIADASKRKAEPIGVLVWRPSPQNDQGLYMLEVSTSCNELDLPLSLSFCANRDNRRATPKESAAWVQSRIVPESRHNIAEVLRANGLTRYDSVELLALSQGRSSDDDLLVHEVDVPQELISDWLEQNAQATSFADRVIAAVRRQRLGATISYVFIELDNESRGTNAMRSDSGLGGNVMSSDSNLGANARCNMQDTPNAAGLIGSLIRTERLAQGLTQKQLAAKAGITQTVLSRTESGTGNPTLSLLEEIAAALNMKLDIKLDSSN